MAKLDLPEELSSKAGRKPFSDWCFSTLLLSTGSVNVVLRRKSDKGLEVYGQPDERRVIDEIELSKVIQERRKNLFRQYAPFCLIKNNSLAY
ncbi:hypothetical protein GCM10028818_00210 [Spirosoma horti]